MSYDVYSGMLKMMDNFEKPLTYSANFTYEHGHPKLIELCDTYSIKQIAGNNGELSQAINLLNWLSDNTFHISNYAGDVRLNSLGLLKYSYKQGIERGLNCQCLATILTECCLSIGLKARTLYIMPFSPYDEDNHVVTMVFITHLDKWIMLDPSYNAYLIDENGKILSPWEARQLLSGQEKIKPCETYNYNGDYTGEISGEPPQYYIEYMAKDLFWFFCAEKNTFNSAGLDFNQMLFLTPSGFDAKKFQIANIEYRIRKYGKKEILTNWLAKVKQDEPVYISFNEFWAKP